ncbi:hypothetical protein ACH3XW_1395 [Acanthocheilonema viteae]
MVQACAPPPPAPPPPPPPPGGMAPDDPQARRRVQKREVLKEERAVPEPSREHDEADGTGEEVPKGLKGRKEPQRDEGLPKT